MERKKHIALKLVVTGIAVALGLANCTTTYDAYGRPVQTVEPGAAAIGAIALGAAAYAIGKDNGTKHRHYYGNRGYNYGYHGHHRGYRRHGCY